MLLLQLYISQSNNQAATSDVVTTALTSLIMSQRFLVRKDGKPRHVFLWLLGTSSVANKARFLACPVGLGLHLEPSKCQAAMKWWLGMDTLGTLKWWLGMDTLGTLKWWLGMDTLGTLKWWFGMDTLGTLKWWLGMDTRHNHNQLRDVFAEVAALILPGCQDWNG